MKAAAQRQKPVDQPFRTVWEGKAGSKVDLRVVEGKGHFEGIAIEAGKIVARTKGAAVEETVNALRGVFARSMAGYVGFEGAKAKFLQIFAQGFETPEYLKRERDYKLVAKAKLDAAVPVKAAAKASGSKLGEEAMRASPPCGAASCCAPTTAPCSARWANPAAPRNRTKSSASSAPGLSPDFHVSSPQRGED